MNILHQLNIYAPLIEISTLFFELVPAVVFSQQSIVAAVIYHQFQGFFPTPKIKEVTAIWKSSIFIRIGVWSDISRLKSPETPGEGFRDATPTPAVGMSSPLQIPWIQCRLTYFITFFRPTTRFSLWSDCFWHWILAPRPGLYWSLFKVL